MDTLASVFREVFENPEIELNPATTANDIDGWDSLSHVSLMMAIELRFDITFSRREIASYRNVGELVAAIDQKLGAKS
jgi:acyl carrier protein